MDGARAAALLFSKYKGSRKDTAPLLAGPSRWPREDVIAQLTNGGRSQYAAVKEPRLRATQLQVQEKTCV